MKSNLTSIQKQLFSLQDTEYRDFHANLMPTIDKELIIGIRVPILRKYARSIENTEEAYAFLSSLPHTYYEENNLHAFLVSAIKDYDSALQYTKDFLPYVDNWATCDSFSPKVFAKHKSELLQEIDIWIADSKPYTQRFGIEMIMTHYLGDNYDIVYSEKVASIRSDEYYVNMMIAWYFATALAKHYEEVLPFIEQHKLDTWTHNKTIQKAIESYRITDMQKQYLRALKIK